MTLYIAYLHEPVRAIYIGRQAVIETRFTFDYEFTPEDYFAASDYLTYTALENGDTLVAEETPEGDPTGRALVVRFANPQCPEYWIDPPEPQERPLAPLMLDAVSDHREVARTLCVPAY